MMTRRIFARMHHAGFAIVTAIFLLVVLAALGVGMMVFSTSQHAESAYDLQGARAYQAARAGIEWALYNRLNPNITPNFCVRTSPTSYGTAGTFANTVSNGVPPFSLPAGTLLSQFTVTINCSAVTTVPNVNVTDSSNQPVQIVIRTINVIACNQPSGGACPGTPGVDYVQRKLQVTLQESQ